MITGTYEQMEPASCEMSLGLDTGLVGEVSSIFAGGVMFTPAHAKLRWTGFDLNRPTTLFIKLVGSNPSTEQRFYEFDMENPNAADGRNYSFEHAPEWVIDLVILRPGVGTLIRDFYDVKGWKQP